MPVSKQILSQDARVAVIGLGAAGIAAVIGLRNAGLRNITVFEATGHAGGTWVYSGNIKNARSSMYKSLRCNIPKESMCYVGRPFHELADSFVSHRDVAAYLQRIADEENLLPLVRFNSPVARLFPVDPDRFETGWGIQTWAKQGASSAAVDENDHQNSATPSRAQFGTDEFGVTSLLSDVEYFDAVVVCNGHFTVPSKWRPEGASEFPGTISHSHTYRMPERFDGKKVVVLGAGPSGIDISLELHRNGADVILSHNDGAGAGMHGGCVPQAAPVVACRPDGGLVLRDGQVIEDVDELMLCTGYAYSMPFLSENCGLRITPDGRAIHGLLMQCVCEKHPTLSVLGIPYKIIPFPLFQDQVQFVAGLLMGTVPFDVTPESLQRISEEERIERENRDLPAKYIHCLDSHQWDYRRRLAEWTGGEAPTESVREIHEDATNARKNDPLRYRSRSYVILGDGSGEWKVSIDPRVEVETMDPCLRESTVN